MVRNSRFSAYVPGDLTFETTYAARLYAGRIAVRRLRNQTRPIDGPSGARACEADKGGVRRHRRTRGFTARDGRGLLQYTPVHVHLRLGGRASKLEAQVRAASQRTQLRGGERHRRRWTEHY